MSTRPVPAWARVEAPAPTQLTSWWRKEPWTTGGHAIATWNGGPGQACCGHPGHRLRGYAKKGRQRRVSEALAEFSRKVRSSRPRGLETWRLPRWQEPLWGCEAGQQLCLGGAWNPGKGLGGPSVGTRGWGPCRAPELVPPHEAQVLRSWNGLSCGILASIQLLRALPPPPSTCSPPGLRGQLEGVRG